MMPQTSIRLPKELLDETDELAKMEHFDKSVVLRQALELGLETLRKEVALKFFAEERLSISEAAELADTSVIEFMELLTKRGIKQELSDKLISQAEKNASKLIKK